jgi:hypothetical protein
MNFMNEDGKKVAIRINDIKDSIINTDIVTVMDALIDQNIFTSTGGDLKTKGSAQIIDKTVQDIAVK